MNTFTNKQTIFILSAGTLLEYFDVMLFIHMSSLLNKTFFATTDKQSEALLSLLSYFMMYLFRPIGAIIFGYLGDKYGRLFVVYITTTLMALSSITIFYLPSYEQIGIAASVIITLCRILQSLSSMGEIIGAEIYLSELLRGTKQKFLAVGVLALMPTAGALLALAVSHFATNDMLSWRYAFLIGFFIVIFSAFLRVHIKKVKEKFEPDDLSADKTVGIKTYLSLLTLNCIHPIAFFIVFFCLSDVLRHQFNFTELEIIDNSFTVNNAIAISILLNMLCLNFIKPLHISRFRITVFTISIALLPSILANVTAAWQITLLQLLLFALGKDDFNSVPIQYSAVPRFKRFRVVALVYSFSRILICIVTTYGMTIALPHIGNITFVIFGLPICFAYHCALSHLKRLDSNSDDPSESYYCNTSLLKS